MSDNNKYKSLDEIVFENRNKAYGAYDLRKTENNALLKALLRGSLVILVIAGLIWLANSDVISGDKTETVVDVTLEDVTLPDVPEEPEVVEPEPEPEPEPMENHYQEETAQVKLIIPEPKKEVKVQETIPDVQEIKGKDISFENREGKETKKQDGGGPVNLDPDAGKNTQQAPKTEAKGDGPPATVTARTAAIMAIYPGCEKDAQKGKEAAQACLNKRLAADIGDELQDFQSIAERQGINVANAKLNFQIDTQGRIVKITPAGGGDQYLGPEAKKALERITQRQQKRGKTIVPAKTDDGKAAILNFSIPVKFQLQ